MIDYIEKGWKAYKNNFWSIVIALILQLVLTFIPFVIGLIPWGIILFYSGIGLTESNLSSLILSNLGVLSFSILMFIFGFLISMVLNGGFVRMLYESLRGKAKYETMLKTAKEKFWSILGANLLVLVIFMLIMAIFFAPLLILANISSLPFFANSFLYVIVLFSVVILGVIVLTLVSVLFVFVNQAIVIDNLRAFDAVKKSFEVSKKNFLGVFFLFLLFFLLNNGLENVLSIFGSIISIFVTTPLLLLSYTAFYVDKRKKRK